MDKPESVSELTRTLNGATQESFQFVFSPSEIPQCQVNSMMADLLAGAKEYFAQPDAQERYQAWLQLEENQRRIERVQQYRKESAARRKRHPA